jgi:type II secretory pathway pseudopilin PulG
MGLRGQGEERGYAMAALLVSLAVMSVLMSVAMPVWRHEARREKEAELAFRGEQYARAIALYRSKNANNFPPSIDVLVQGKYLRKKYKDPMSPDGEFRIVPLGGQAGQQGTAPGTGPQVPGRGGTTPQPPPVGQTPAASGGIIGVASKSTETSIRIYKGQTRYDQWPFTFNMANRPGGNAPGADAPGMPGGRGQGQPGMGGRGPGGRGPGGRGPGGRGTNPLRPGDRGTQPGSRGFGPPIIRPPGG